MEQMDEGNEDLVKPPFGPQNHVPPTPEPDVVRIPLPPNVLNVQGSLLGILNHTSLLFLQVLNFVSYILRSDCSHTFEDVRLRTQIEPLILESSCYKIYEIIFSEQLHRDKWVKFKEAMINVFNDCYLIGFDEKKLITSTFISTYGLLEQSKFEVANLLRFNTCVHGFLEKASSRNIKTWSVFVSTVPKLVMTGLRIWGQIANETGVVFKKVSWKTTSPETSDDNEDLITFFTQLCLRSERAFNFDEMSDSEEEADNEDMMRNIPEDQRTWDCEKMKKVIEAALAPQGQVCNDAPTGQASVS